MKNPFRPKSKPHSQELNPEAGTIREPWNRKSSASAPAPRKTIVGKKPNEPFLDKKETPPAHPTPPPCPKCSYPLRSEVSAATPCPHCSFTGSSPATPAPQKAPSTTRPTMRLSELQFEQSSGTRSFSLVDEAHPSNPATFDLGKAGDVIIGREHLDPSNSTIASEKHIRIYENYGQWYVSTMSTTHATFVQALEYQPLTEGGQLVLGHRRFRFLSDSPAPVAGDTQKTLSFDQLQWADRFITLLDERTDTTLRFGPPPITLDRSGIDANELSISRQQHARIEIRQGQWMIIDQSSNRATFVQVVNDQPLPNQTRLLLGNKIFRFELK